MITVLGSASPRRKELLAEIIPAFIVMPADIDESYIAGESPLAHCCRLSEEKGAAVAGLLKTIDEDHLVITSDTIVTIDEEILGKPEDKKDAFRMLSLLSGKTHQVITAVTLSLLRPGASIVTSTSHEVTDVTFKDLSPEEIRHYLEMVHYSDKAGSYAIQEHGELIIESISGSRTNVIGFPRDLFQTMLAGLGLSSLIINK